MRVISIRQPWASLIASGLRPVDGSPVTFKDVENRSWTTNYRGPLAIHASKGTSKDDFEAAYSTVWDLNLGDDDDVDNSGDYRSNTGGVAGFERACIIGVVTLVDVVKDSKSPWACEGQFHWVLARPVKLVEPIIFRGGLGLTELPVEFSERLTALYGVHG